MRSTGRRKRGRGRERHCRGGDILLPNSSFNVRRARTKISGQAFKKSVSYVLNLDAVDDGLRGGGNLKDGHVTWNFLSSDSNLGRQFQHEDMPEDLRQQYLWLQNQVR